MKKLNFFSNKLALAAIVAVSSIMLMSFQNADSKKQSNCFTQVQTQIPNTKQISGKIPTLTSKLVADMVTATWLTVEYYISVSDGGAHSRVMSEIDKEKRMSKF